MTFHCQGACRSVQASISFPSALPHPDAYPWAESLQLRLLLLLLLRSALLCIYLTALCRSSAHALVQGNYIDCCRPLSALPTMIGTSTFDLYFIRTSIFFLRFVAPLCAVPCIAAVARYGFRAAISPVPLVFGSVAAAEALFYLVGYLPYQARLQREAVHPSTLSRPERKDLFQKCHDTIPDGEAYLKKWFLGAPAEEIKRENLKEFFLWAFFNRGGPPGNDEEELEEYVVQTEQLLGREIAPGRGNATCLRLTLDRVNTMCRPLVWYTVSLYVHGVDDGLTSSRSLAWLIPSHTCHSFIMASTSTVWPSGDFSPYSHSDH